MIGEIERLLLNKLNNGERYFCSSELPRTSQAYLSLTARQEENLRDSPATA